MLSPGQAVPVLVLGVLLSLAAGAGIVRIVLGSRARQGCPNEVRVAGLLIACLVAGPLILLAAQFNYQGTKLFLSHSPLLALGVVALLRPLQLRGDVPGATWGRRTAEAVRGGSAAGWRVLACRCLIALFAGNTFLLAAVMCWDSHVSVSGQGAAFTPELRVLRQGLRATPTDNVILALGPGMALNTEMCFAARRHRVWLVCPEINDDCVLGCTTHPFRTPLPFARQLVDLTRVPKEALVVTLAGAHSPLRIEGDKRLVNQCSHIQVWRVGPGPYTLIPTNYAQRPGELDHPSPELLQKLPR
jgi:hypothetical protein